MTPTQREAALRLADLMDSIIHMTDRNFTEAAALLRELAAEPVQGEPAAWMWQHGEAGFTGFIEHASDEDLRAWERINKPRKIVAPLYAHPPQQRKPLTDAQIAEIRRECVLLPSKYDSHYGWAIHFARAIEKAITGEST